MMRIILLSICFALASISCAQTKPFSRPPPVTSTGLALFLPDSFQRVPASQDNMFSRITYEAQTFVSKEQSIYLDLYSLVLLEDPSGLMDAILVAMAASSGGFVDSLPVSVQCAGTQGLYASMVATMQAEDGSTSQMSVGLVLFQSDSYTFLVQVVTPDLGARDAAELVCANLKLVR